MDEPTRLHGLLARFDSPGDLLEAARQVRGAGYTSFDCHSPFAIHGIEDAMGVRRSPLGYIVAVFAFAGLAGMTLLTWWTSAVDYKMVIAGKPFFSYQAYVPVLFAISILFAAVSAALGMCHLNRLPRLYHPLFVSKQFGRVTDDGFFVSIQSSDPKFGEQTTRSFLESVGGKDVEVIREE